MAIRPYKKMLIKKILRQALPTLQKTILGWANAHPTNLVIKIGAIGELPPETAPLALIKHLCRNQSWYLNLSGLTPL